MKNISYKKYSLYFRNNKYYWLKKKKGKKIFIVSKMAFLNYYSIVQKFIIFNVYKKFLLKKYNIIKNFWFFFLSIYILLSKNIKVGVKFLFNYFIIKNLINNLFKNNKVLNKNKYFLKFFLLFKLQYLLKKKYINYHIILKNIKKKKNILIFLY